MNISIITVRDRAYHPTRRLIEAAEQKGHRVTLIHPYRLWPMIAGNTPAVIGDAAFEMPDVILPRQGAQIGLSCLVLISQLSLMGIPMVNGLDAIRLASNQFLTLQVLAAAGIPVPDTLFINAADGTRHMGAHPGDFPLVVKEINGRQGSGVACAENKNELKQLVRKRLQRTRGLLLQKFIPTRGRRDIRALVIGGEVVGAMRLVPPAGDFRANYHLGATGQAQVLTDTEAGVAVTAARAVGLDIAGVDLVMDDRGRIYVIEVNYAPGFRGLEKVTGLDIAGLIVAYAGGVVAQHR